MMIKKQLKIPSTIAGLDVTVFYYACETVCHYVNVVDRGVMVALDGVMGLFVSIMDLALMLIGIIVTLLEVQFLTVLNHY